MTPSARPAPCLTRRAFALAAWAALLAPAGLGLRPSVARADDEDDRSGDDDDGGRGRGRGGDDEGGGGRDDSDDRSGPDRPGGAPRDIAVRYPDGWVERIVSGRYELIDDQRRLVVGRVATGGDFARMDALR